MSVYSTKRYVYQITAALILILSANTASYGSVHGYFPVFVSLTGYNSCGGNSNPAETSLLPNVLRLKDQVAAVVGVTSEALPWASSCFQASNRFDSNVLVKTSQPVDGFYLHEKISYLAANGSVAPLVILIGHSWGGMHAIETAIAVKDMLLGWSQHPGHEYLAASKVVVITLDAIDSHLCAQPIVNVLGNPTCKGLPRTLFSEGGVLFQRAIQNGPWINFYQDSGFLHSGAVPIPNIPTHIIENYRMDYRRQLSPHLRIARDPVVWDIILERLTSGAI